MRKIYLTLLILLTLSSCASISANSSKTTLNRPEKSINTNSVGIIHMNEKNCLPFIEVTEAGISLRLHPINLPEKFAQEGFKIKFNYKLSSAPIVNNCEIDKMVEIFDVRL